MDAGAAFIRAKLGVDVAPGGEHPRMGTHNRLLGLGPAVYLEVIAANPAAAAPQRPRWFALDRLAPDAAPRLATWVARVDDIDAAVAASPDDFGEIESMSRGTLRWRITVPRDGGLVCDGVMPSLIQWETEPHPATRLPDLGCRLSGLHVRHRSGERVSAALRAIGFSGPVTVTAAGEPSLGVDVETREGPRTL